ncbi:MAG TPA: 5-oxoprolinase subunit PxpB [Candidatus Didemnitutus sp.]|nr:5-oxoprolinase subunit PxpB [Candidatus Didemnitutus sp.]
MPAVPPNMKPMEIVPLGDSALLVTLGDRIDEANHARVRAATLALEHARPPAVTEIVPAYASVTVFYHPLQAIAEGAPESDVAGWLAARVRERLARLPSRPSVPAGRRWEIPVCYDADFAPDLPEIAARTGVSRDNIVAMHTQATFLVYLIGFAPGFPYLGGLPEQLSMPRRAESRKRVAPGSVGIIGTQCCVYPVETPGGWNLIGRTPMRLYRPESDRPALLRAGDRVTFHAISRQEFDGWKES